MKMKRHSLPERDRAVPIWTSIRGVTVSALLLLVSGLTVQAQTPTVSPAAAEAHSTITAYAGPATCIACHQEQALQMFGSVHYQEMGETPQVANIDGLAGKGRNGHRVMNSYCGTPVTSSRATCATCHAGNGRIPSPQLTLEQLNNIDCLLCHQDAYKRVPAPPYETLTMPGPDGGTHTIQTVVEDETGFDFIPDTAKMSISIVEAARTVHRPTRASCLRCHAGAGGSDGGKRGDISTVTVNPPLTSDVHMSPQGANLACVNCHNAGGHRVRGRGVDLRPTDSTDPLTCARCHTDRPHGDFAARNGTARDVHAQRVACQSCHIPAYAKDVSTEMERDWTEAHFSMTACRGQGGWVPSEVRASHVVPDYHWFDGTSLANVLGQVPVQNALGEYILALPNGSVQSPGAKLFPMKVHHSNSARQDDTGLLIPHSTFAYFTSGNFDLAVQKGMELSGMNGPASLVPLVEYQTINHGVEAASQALQCGACHASQSSGGPVRMDLQGKLGYALKGTTTQVCSQCHGNKTSKGFLWVHDKHVREKGYDCSSCHNFSRPERGLREIRAIRPSPPGGPTAVPVSATQIEIFWADNSSTEQGFRVERSRDGVNFSEISAVGENVTSLQDSAVSPGVSYYYRVRAFNATGLSDYSMVGRASTAVPAPTLPPAAPTALTATATSISEVRLAWTDNSADETGFAIEVSIDNANFAVVASVGPDTSAFTHAGLNPGTTYYYRVRAFNQAGSSTYSNTASVTTPAAVVPLAPTELRASAKGGGKILLTWKQSTSGNITHNRVYRSTVKGGPYALVATIPAQTSYLDSGLLRGTAAYYVITAVNSAGLESLYSKEASARAR